MMVFCLLVVSCGKQGPDKIAGAVSAPDKTAPIVYGIGMNDTKGGDPIDIIPDLAKVGFGVFAGYTAPGENFGDGSFFHTYLKNARIDQSADPEVWECSDPTYWPIRGRLSLFAYAPYAACVEAADGGDVPLLLPSADYDGGLARGTFTPDANVDAQADFCLAAPAMDKDRTAGRIPFVFKHALTRVRFYVNAKGNPDPRFRYGVTNIELHGIVGTNNFTYTLDPETPFVWDSISSESEREANYKFSFPDNIVDSLKFITNDKAKYLSNPDVYIDPDADGLSRFTYTNQLYNGRVYLLPQELTEKAGMTFIITIYTRQEIGWVPISIMSPIEVQLPSDVPWTPGKTVSYLITLDVAEIKVANIKAVVTDWMDSGNVYPTQIIDY